MKLLCLVTVSLAGWWTMIGAEVSIPKVTLARSGAVVAEVRYAAQSSQIAALQFDLNYDAVNLTVSAVTGPAAMAAGKLASSQDVSPGRKRILLIGFSQSALADGVVVSLMISSSSSAPGSYELRLTDGVASDKDGNAVALAMVDGTVSVVENSVPQGAAAFGQIVSGGPWKTTLTLINLSSAPAKARLNFWGGDGQPLLLPVTSVGLSGAPTDSVAALDCSLEPQAIYRIETEGSETSATVAGWAELQTSDAVTGFAVLRLKIWPDRESEGISDLEQRRGSGFVFPYDETGGLRTGIAIANQSPTMPADLALILRDEAGGTLSSESLSLPVRGHVSFVASDRFPTLLGRRGTIEVRNALGEPIAVLALRFNPSGSFVSLPVVPK